jgi:hypothetical protein
VRYNSGTCSLGRQVVNGRDEEADSPLLSSSLLFSSHTTGALLMPTHAKSPRSDWALSVLGVHW